MPTSLRFQNCQCVYTYSVCTWCKGQLKRKKMISSWFRQYILDGAFLDEEVCQPGDDK